MNKRQLFLWVIVIGVLVVGGTAVFFKPTAHTNAMPLAQLLNADGTLNLDNSYTGTVDPAGWEMVLNENGVPTFQPAAITGTGAWVDDYGVPGVETGFGGTGVNAIAVDSQGNVYIGGNFEIAGNQNADNLAMWDGSNWHPVGQGVNNTVYSLAIDASDNLYVGGIFTQATNSDSSTLNANRIATWDGSSWSLLGDDDTSNGNGLNSRVNALVVDGNGYLFAGGQFTTAYNASGSSLSANRLARWDGSTWTALGADNSSTGNGLSSTVNALAVSGTTIFAGGDFFTAYTNSATPVDANHVAAWDTKSSSWAALGTGTGTTGNGVSGTVNALIVAANGDLYVGGAFGTAYDNVGTNVSSLRLARWNGSSWGGSDVALGVNFTVNALALDGNMLFIGGAFGKILSDNGDANFVATFDTADSSWGSLGSEQNNGNTRGNGVDSTVSALAVGNGGVYVAGLEGPFRAYNSLSSSVGMESIVFWDDTASQWDSLSNDNTQGANLDGSLGVRVMAIDGQNNMYVGGSFTTIGNLSANHLARWDGSSWSVLGTDSGDRGNGVDGPVYSLAIDSSDNLYVGGDFQNTFTDSAASSYAANRIVMWNGSSWLRLGTDNGVVGNGVNAAVWALSVDSNDNVAVGGQFINAYNANGNNVSANHVALWNGSTWTALGANSGSSGNGVNDFVRALAWDDTELFVGGDFATAYNNSSSSVSASHVAQWNGSSWAALSGGLNNDVYALLVHGSDLYVGGNFLLADGADANRIAKWDGAVWSTLGSGSGLAGNGVDGNVYALAVSENGQSLLAGGAFNTAYNNVGNSVPASKMAAWNINDSSWTTFAGGLDDAVYALTPGAGNIWVGGLFTHADGLPSGYIGRWLNDALVADLSVGKTAVSTTILTNEPVTYTLSINNSGPISSTNVVLTDTLSLAAKIITAPTASQGTCTTVANPLWTISCDLGNVAVGASVTVTYAAAPSLSGSLVNTVLAVGDTADPNISNNVAQVAITVVDPVTPTNTPTSSPTPTMTPTPTITPTPSATPLPSQLSLRRSALNSSSGMSSGTTMQLKGQSSPIGGIGGFMGAVYSGFWQARLPILRLPVGSFDWGTIDWDNIVFVNVPPMAPSMASPLTVHLIPQVGEVGALAESQAPAGVSFHVEAYDELGTAVTTFTEPYTITINYTDAMWQSTEIDDENSLNLAYWDVSTNQWQTTHPCDDCSLNTETNQIITALNHMTEFALIGKSGGEMVFLPIITKP